MTSHGKKSGGGQKEQDLQRPKAGRRVEAHGRRGGCVADVGVREDAGVGDEVSRHSSSQGCKMRKLQA